MHAGNSSISYRDGTMLMNAGFIQTMWIHDSTAGVKKTYLLVEPHCHLSKKDEKNNPYTLLPGLKANIVYAHLTTPIAHTVIEINNVITHIPFYMHLKGTFRIKNSTLVLVNSLHR